MTSNCHVRFLRGAQQCDPVTQQYMMKQVKILLVAYFFPPDLSSGSFRPFFFANHLTEMGDEIIVLTSREEDFLTGQPLDQKLVTKLDRRVRVVRSRVRRPKEYLLRMRDRLARRSRMPSVPTEDFSIKSKSGAGWIRVAKDFISNLITTPDQHVGWITSCIRQGLAIVREQRPDVILVTGGPWSGLLAASHLKRLTGVPLVLDFRDPWAASPYQVKRGKLFKRIDAWLERRVVQSADLLVANTEELRHDFLQRYPDLSPDRVVVITNGFEDYLPDLARGMDSALKLTHVGALYSSRNPGPLLEAARNLIERGRVDQLQIKLRFIGGIEMADSVIARILASPCLAKSVEVIPRIAYEESLRAMSESDMLIIYQPGYPLQIPRKLYDYMASRRPILCIAEPGSATWSLVGRYSLGMTCENDTARLEEALLTIYREWRSGRLKPLIDDDRCEPFRNHRLAKRLQNYLEQTIRTSTKGREASSPESSS